MTNSTATEIRKPSREDRLAEAARYYRNGKECDRRWQAGDRSLADEDGRYRIEGRLAHEWLSLAWSTARYYGFTHDDVRAEAAR
jgi:hypothetical protein